MSNKGSAYIYVCMLMAAIASMLLICVYAARMQVKVTDSYHRYANIDAITVSGAQKAEEVLNKLMQKQHDKILADTLTELNTLDLNGQADYVWQYNLYDGEFKLKKDDEDRGVFARVYSKNAWLLAQSALQEISDLGGGVDASAGKYVFEYDFRVDEIAYTVNVQITPGTETKRNFDIVSTAYAAFTDLKGEVINIEKTITCVIVCKGGSQTETILPSFKWRTTPGWAQLPVSMSVGSFYNSAFDIPSAWSEEAPVVVDPYGIVDVSSFYVNGQPLPTVIVNRNFGTLNIQRSDPARNVFKGIIYSAGNIAIDGVNFEGSVVSGAVVTLNDSSYSPPDTDMLFRVKIADETLRRKVYDFFGATKFHSGGEVFLNADFGNAVAYIIKDMNEIRFRIEKLATKY